MAPSARIRAVAYAGIAFVLLWLGGLVLLAIAPESPVQVTHEELADSGSRRVDLLTLATAFIVPASIVTNTYLLLRRTRTGRVAGLVVAVVFVITSVFLLVMWGVFGGLVLLPIALLVLSVAAVVSRAINEDRVL